MAVTYAEEKPFRIKALISFHNSKIMGNAGAMSRNLVLWKIRTTLPILSSQHFGRLKESPHAEDFTLCTASRINGTQRFRPLFEIFDFS
jgi:hypothetical protein